MHNWWQKILMDEAKGGEGGGSQGGGAGGSNGGDGGGGAGNAGGGRSVDLSGGGSASDLGKGGKSGDEGGGQGAAGKGDNANGGDGKGGDKGGSGSVDWRTSLPDTVKGAKSLEKFKDVTSLAQGYLSLESAMGGKKLVVPDPKTATKEDWNEFYKAIGRPDAPEKYDLKMPDGVTAKVDDKFLKDFRAFAHEKGVPASMANDLFGWYMKESHGRMSGAKAAAEGELKKMNDELDKEWGAKWDENMNKAKVGIEQFLDDKEKDWAKKAGLLTHPMFARIFAKIGDGMAEDTFKGDHNNPAVGKTVDEIESELAAIRADSAWLDTAHPGHQAAIDKKDKLTRELLKMKEKAKK